MNIYVIISAVLLLLAVTVICAITVLPSPTITYLLRRFGKGNRGKGA